MPSLPLGDLGKGAMVGLQGRQGRQGRLSGPGFMRFAAPFCQTVSQAVSQIREILPKGHDTYTGRGNEHLILMMRKLLLARW